MSGIELLMLMAISTGACHLIFRRSWLTGLIVISIPAIKLFSFTKLNLSWFPVFASGPLTVFLLSFIGLAGQLDRRDLQNFFAAIFLRVPAPESPEVNCLQKSIAIWRQTSWKNCVLTAFISTPAIFLVGYFSADQTIFQAEPPSEDLAGIFLPALILLIFNQIWLKLVENRLAPAPDNEESAGPNDYPGLLWLLPPLGIFICWFQEIGTYISSF
ncbi:MAG: hypothetical protein ACOYXC_16175 [Candidatus Rifleibacteriota bacterium]